MSASFVERNTAWFVVHYTVKNFGSSRKNMVCAKDSEQVKRHVHRPGEDRILCRKLFVVFFRGSPLVPSKNFPWDAREGLQRKLRPVTGNKLRSNPLTHQQKEKKKNLHREVRNSDWSRTRSVVYCGRSGKMGNVLLHGEYVPVPPTSKLFLS